MKKSCVHHCDRATIARTGVPLWGMVFSHAEGVGLDDVPVHLASGQKESYPLLSASIGTHLRQKMQLNPSCFEKTHRYCQEFLENHAFMQREGGKQQNEGERELNNRSNNALLPAAYISYAGLIYAASVDDGMPEIGQMWCAASLADRRRTECTSEGARRSAVPQMGHLRAGRWPTDRENF